MFIKIILVFVSYTIINADLHEDTVRYYEKIITSEIWKSKNYEGLQNANEYKPSSNKIPEVVGKFDYIIVGGGTSGAVIATRLSENQDMNILLVEAGTYGNDFTEIPAMSQYLLSSPYNWNYISTPQQNVCLDMKNKQCPLPSGKGIGGTTIINNLWYARGNKHDFNTWQSMGNLGWSYDNVLPYFIKSENSQINGDRGYHGKEGPWNVDYSGSHHTPYYHFIRANQEFDRELVDYNGKKELGITPIQMNILSGRRDSTGRAFLQRAGHRNNLKVLTNSYATKIILSKRSKKALGIVFSNSEGTYIAYASNEVIVSAGALGSPKLLMLSGIGPRSHLAKLKIPLIKDLPVGVKYYDEPIMQGLFFKMNHTHSKVSLRDNIVNYLNGKGLFTTSQDAEAAVVLQTKLAKFRGVPDIAIVLTPILFKDNYTEMDTDTSNMFGIQVFLIHPESSGTFKLQSANPYDYPLVDPNSFSEERDLETMRLGIEMVLELMISKAFRELDVTLVRNDSPSCRSYKYLSKDYWYCQIKHQSVVAQYSVGTCRMGLKYRNDSVVNNRLKVHGIRNLRVADESIFPTSTAGVPTTASVMIGEYVSAMIKSGL